MKRRIYHISAISYWLLAISFVVLSCTDDITPLHLPEGGKNGQLIQFCVDDTQDWYQTKGDEMLTRGISSKAFAPHTIVMTSSEGATNMKLTSTVVNGINSEGIRGNKEMTRGVPQTNLTGNFRISAYTIPADADWNTATKTNYFYNLEATTDNNETWTIAAGAYWPNADKDVRFFAYSPNTTTDADLQMSPATNIDAPYIDFKVKDNIENQADLMTATSIVAHYRNGRKAELPFRHALTCVKFALGSGFPTGTRIKFITLKNIVNRGRLTLGEGWTPSTATTDKTDFEIGSLDYDVASHSPGNIIMPSGAGDASSATLLMIPQSFRTGQQIEVVYDTGSGSNEVTLTADLADTEWLAGTTVTYHLSTNTSYEYILEVTPIAVGHNGGDVSFGITSYKQPTTGNTKTPLPWRIIGYSTDGGTTWTTEKPQSANWAAIGTINGNGGSEMEKGYVHIQPQAATATAMVSAETETANQIAAMKSNAPTGRGSESSPLDLSLYNVSGNCTMSRNTANCYVINAFGWYKLPLVYGNAIKNGATNAEAYTGSPCIDYLGSTIENPYIYNNHNYMNRIGEAVIVWQDVPSSKTLLSNVRLSTDKCFIEFQIEEDNLTPGNAVIAVRDKDGVIMWSWHIWITGQDVFATKRVIDYYRQTYDMMPVDLGWISIGGGQSTYEGHNIKVKVMQEQSGRISTFDITQLHCTENTGLPRGSQPFYQWGRKDPLMPTNGNDAFKTCSSPINMAPISLSESGNSIAKAIRNPNVHYQNDWGCGNNYPNLWCVGYTAKAPMLYHRGKKTIYDPCPAGFRVPDPYVFTAFHESGITEASTNKNTWYYDKVVGFNRGICFYTDATKTETLPFCLNGCISSSDGSYNNSVTMFWTCTLNSSNHSSGQASDMYFMSSGSIYTIGWDSSSYGNVIRPVREYYQ